MRTECSRASPRRDSAGWPEDRPGKAVREGLVVQEGAPEEAAADPVAEAVLAAEQEDPEVAPAAAVPVVVAAIGNHAIPLQTFSSVFKSPFLTAHTSSKNFSDCV